MPTLNLKITFEDGDRLFTRFNGTEADARAYYLWRLFNHGTCDRDRMIGCTRVDVLG